MQKLNAAWHKKHIMPKNPTEQQRLVWHVAHAKNCQCRPMPKGFLSALKKRAQE